MYDNVSKNSNNSANVDSSFNFDIRNFVDQLTPNPKEKGKYICPNCNSHNLSVNLKNGKFNCWNCGDTKAIARHLTGNDSHSNWQNRLDKQLDQYVAQKKNEQQQRQTQEELKREHPDLSEAEIERCSALINNPLTVVDLDPAEKLKSDIQAYLLEKDPYAKAKIRVAILRNHGLSREILDNLIIETAIGSQSKQFKQFQGMDFLDSDLEPVQFLVQGVPIGGTTILAGSSGSGKTTLAYWLGKCVLDGNEFLGDTPSTTGGVFIVNSDEGIHTAHDRVVDMDYPADNRWMFLSNFKLDYHFEELEELIRDRQPKLLIVDSFCGIHGQAFEENSSIAGITVEKFNRLAETYNCAIVMIHHLNKAGELRGSSRIKDTAHSVLLIEENKDGTREYKSKKIRCASTFEYTLKLDYEGIPMVCQGGESKMHLNIKEIILGCLQASTKPLEPAEIVELTLLSKQQVWDGLKKLRDTGKAKCRRSKRDKRVKVWMPTTAHTHTHTPSNDESSKIPELHIQQGIETKKNILDPSANLIDPSVNSSIPNEGSSIQVEQSSIESSNVNPIQQEDCSEITRPLSETTDESEGAECDSSAHHQQEKPNSAAEYYTLKSGDFVFGSNKLFQLKEKHHNMWLTVEGIYVSYADWLAGNYRKPTNNDIKFLLCQATDKVQLEFLVKHYQTVVIGQLLEKLPQSVTEQILDLD
jgi:predicted ATP-dependent serine protease